MSVVDIHMARSLPNFTYSLADWLIYAAGVQFDNRLYAADMSPRHVP